MRLLTHLIFIFQPASVDCQGYLKTQVANESQDAVTEFVDEHIPNNLVHLEAILERKTISQLVQKCLDAGKTK